MGNKVSTPRFHRPPLNKPLSIPELYDWHYEVNREYPLFVFEDSPGTLRTITMGEAVQGMHRATRIVRDRLGASLAGDSQGKPPVLAILAASDSVTFFCTFIGALRTGVTLFPVSTRNSAAAIAFLLSETNPVGLLISSEASLQQIADEAVKASKYPDLQRIEMPVFEDLFPCQGYDPHFKSVPSAKLDLDMPSVIYHSSGTTAFPKPIVWTNRHFYRLSLLPYFGETDISNSVFGCHCVPLFHGMGANLFCYPTSVGVILGVFKPHAPAIVPNSVNVFEGALATHTDFLFGPPSFFETWSRDEKYVEEMSKMKGIVYGGGPLAKYAGDALASKGVNVYQTFASTETSLISEFLPPSPGMDWDYFKFSPNKKVHLEPFSDNEFRIVLLTSEDSSPVLFNTKIDGIDGYATSDLVSPHPTKTGYFKVMGRTDDQIMHSNGEKTNPGPLEAILKQNPLIEDAAMFGRARFQCGVLIQPTKAHAIDPSNLNDVEDFRNAIWPTVEKLNAFAPSHSRLFKEASIMILIASPEKPFEYTAKASLRRQSVINAYASEIDAIYDAVEESAQNDIVAPDDWSEISVHQFTRNVVERTMKKSAKAFGDDADLFEYGLDSLQATWLRNTMLRALRESHPKLVHNLSANFVYEHPTISGLASYLHSSVLGDDIPDAEKIEARKAELIGLVTRYSSSFPTFTASADKSAEGQTVLLTGATGSLGSNILAKLLQSSSVFRVVVLSRPSSESSLASRLLKVFEKEGLDIKFLHDERIVLLDGDASKSDFAIGEERYAELRSSVTHVVHNAWRVNFSNSVASFESNIRSVRNFLDFCLGYKGATPARLLFISSIGVFQQSYSENPEPEVPLPIHRIPLGSGYGESKWVSEQILNEATGHSASRITIIRPGQITGGISGSWNEHEWFPSLIKSSVTLGKLPAIEGSVSWISANVAAGAIVDMLESHGQVFHLAHPRPVKWSVVISWFSKALSLPVVTYNEWLNALDRSSSIAHSGNASEVEAALRANPALRLLDMFRSAKEHISENLEPLGLPRLATEKAEEASDTLRNAERLDERSVEDWTSYWKTVGFLE